MLPVNLDVGPLVTLYFLLVTAFLAATLLPLASELWFVGALALYPSWAWLFFCAATLGNILGSATTYWLGGLLAQKLTRRKWLWLSIAKLKVDGHAAQRMQQWGPLGLAFAWVPVLGDALVLAAGWLRLPFIPCLCWLSLGKASRYAILWWGVKQTSLVAGY